MRVARMIPRLYTLEEMHELYRAAKGRRIGPTVCANHEFV